MKKLKQILQGPMDKYLMKPELSNNEQRNKKARIENDSNDEDDDSGFDPILQKRWSFWQAIALLKGIKNGLEKIVTTHMSQRREYLKRITYNLEDYIAIFVSNISEVLMGLILLNQLFRLDQN
ncbi:MAG: hypothetical protein EZS28_044877 [Streblomastix strix]|uniref:Uncharacterized protein n=1 Tax=Streblomastix strix TaxID=222440 RepID=A0A5J4TM56_9EUKA|nr:MAG: hypothetical protein EZS28_044877 [Streblomastix strix]